MKKFSYIVVLVVFAVHGYGFRQRIQKRAAIQTVSSGFPQLFGTTLEYTTTAPITGQTETDLASIAAEITTDTCLAVTKNAGTPAGNYIEFDTGSSCLPNQIGRTQNGKTTITIALTCTKAQLTRVFLSALGLYYMHQRGDRDHHVGIVPQTGATTSTRIPIPALIPKTFSRPYDFQTIMNVASIDDYNFYKADATCSAAVAVTTGTTFTFWDKYMLNKLYSCTLQNLCSTANPCQNGATCFDGFLSGIYACHCPPGYSGTNCDTNSSPCSPDPCQNGGTCAPGTGGIRYTCTCSNLFTGSNCEIGLLLSGWTNGLNGHQYTLSTTSMTWLEANKYCLDRDSNLAFTGVRNPSSFNQLFKVEFTTNDIWIALTKMEGRFRWSVDGIGSNFHTWTNWGTNEPDLDDDKLCVMIQGTTSTTRQMFSANCNLMKRALCEKPLGYPPAFPSYKASNNLTYFLTPPMSFYAAKRECQRFGAWLAVDGVATSSLLLTIAENIVPADPSPAPKFFYVGYEDTDSSNVFKPVKMGTNILPGDVRWSTVYGGDPNNWGGIEECVASKRDINGTLVDIDCGGRRLRHGICEAEMIVTERHCPSGKLCPMYSKCVYVAVNGAELCKCRDGFFMLNDACLDANECAARPDLCGTGGTCVNCHGSYTCHCSGTSTFDSVTRKCV